MKVKLTQTQCDRETGVYVHSLEISAEAETQDDITFLLSKALEMQKQ